MIGPDAGEAIGLQLLPHRQRIAVALAHVLAQFGHLVGDAEQVLHVVADLMRDHVSLRKVSRGAEPVGELVEEGEVDIHTLVGRAIERTHRRLAKATGGLSGIAEQNQSRLAVGLADLPLEDVTPHILGALEDARHEVRFRIVAGRPGRAALLGGRVTRRAAARGTVESAEQGARVGAQHQRQHDNGDQAEATLEQAAADRDRNARPTKAAASQPTTTKSTTAKVVTSTFLGDCFHIETTTGNGTAITAQVAFNEEPFAPGESVHVYWHPADELPVRE